MGTERARVQCRQRDTRVYHTSPQDILCYELYPSWNQCMHVVMVIIVPHPAFHLITFQTNAVPSRNNLRLPQEALSALRQCNCRALET